MEHAAALEEAGRHGEEAAAAAGAQAEATADRHLALIDRLMAEKDDLGAKLAAADQSLQVRLWSQLRRHLELFL